MVKLSVVIVNFNAGDYLIKCLKSIESEKKKVNLEVYLVDNASEDDSIFKARKLYPNFKYIQNNKNLGFGRANNIAFKIIKSEYILLLNPDCELSPGVLKVMLNFLEQDSTIGAVSCKVLLDNGKLDWATHRGFPTPTASFKYYFLKDDSLYHLSLKDLDSPHEVDSISGSFFFTRKKVLDMVGSFDEKFFMYGEDIDLCWRIKESGWKIYYNPEGSIIHHKGISSGLKKHSQEITTASLNTKEKAFDAFYKAMKIFYEKHYQKKYPFFINWLVYLGINLKWWLAKRNLEV